MNLTPPLPTLAAAPAANPVAASPARNDAPIPPPEFSRVLADRQAEQPADAVPATDEPTTLPVSDGERTEIDPATADIDHPDDDAPPEATLVALTLDLARQHLQPQRDSHTTTAAADTCAAHPNTAAPARRLPATTRPEHGDQATAGARGLHPAAVRFDASAVEAADAVPAAALEQGIRTPLPDTARSATTPPRPTTHEGIAATRPMLRRDTSSVPAAGRLPTQPDTTLRADTITTRAVTSVQAAAAHGSDLPHPASGDTTTLPDALAPVAAQPLPTSAGFGTAVASDTMALHMTTPLATAQWQQELGRHLVTLASRADSDTQHAELRLDPPELGPLRITLTLNDGFAHASFVSPHASVRQAVEAALEHLQANLAEAGISLGQTSVNDQSEREAATFDTASQFAVGQKSAPATADSSSATATPQRSSDNTLLDLYA